MAGNDAISSLRKEFSKFHADRPLVFSTPKKVLKKVHPGNVEKRRKPTPHSSKPDAQRLLGLVVSKPSSRPTTPRSKNKAGFVAPVPTSPFDDEQEDDPWMIFPEWQLPYSALRDDTASYRRAVLAAHAAEREKPRSWLPDLTLEERQNLIQRSLRLGPYEWLRSPTKPRRRQAAIPAAETESLAGSPMKICTP